MIGLLPALPLIDDDFDTRPFINDPFFSSLESLPFSVEMREQRSTESVAVNSFALLFDPAPRRVECGVSKKYEAIETRNGGFERWE